MDWLSGPSVIPAVLIAAGGLVLVGGVEAVSTAPSPLFKVDLSTQDGCWAFGFRVVWVAGSRIQDSWA